MAQKKIAFSLCAIISHHACPGKEGILGCHPDLAGRDLQRGTLTRESRGEQAQAGLDALESAEMSRMARLNGEYKERFGFPFVICARMCDKANILQQLSQRARGGEGARRRGGEEDRPPASPGPRAHWLSGQVVSHLLQCKDSHYHQTYTWL